MLAAPDGHRFVWRAFVRETGVCLDAGFFDCLKLVISNF